MPELPEVETVRRGLEKLVVTKVVQNISSSWPKSFPNASADVESFVYVAKVIAVVRRAKVLLVELDSKYSLMIHLKMTGQLVYRGQQNFGAGHPNDSLVGNLPDKSTRVTITFTDGSKLFFNDQRKFGWVKLLPTIEVPNIDFMKKVGPEPLSSKTYFKDFLPRIRRRNGTSVKAAILDQGVIAGVGNIYADESLWGAKIHPATRVKFLSDKQLEELFEQIKYILALAIEKGGSTDKNYVDAEGKSGSYLGIARVFRREGELCERCHATIVKIRVAGRGTHLCPNCQKEVNT